MIAGAFPGAVFQLRMSGIAWAVPAFLLGVLTAVFPLDGFYRWRLKDCYPEFVRYNNLRHPYDHEKAAAPTFLASRRYCS